MKKCLAIVSMMTLGLASGSAIAAEGNPWRAGQAVQPTPSPEIQQPQFRQMPTQQGRNKYAPLDGNATATTRDLYPSQNPAFAPDYAAPYGNYGAPMGTGLGYPGYGYPGTGYPGPGYSGFGYPGYGYPGIGYPGTGLGGSPYGWGNSWPGMGGFNSPLSIMPFW